MAAEDDLELLLGMGYHRCLISLCTCIAKQHCTAQHSTAHATCTVQQFYGNTAQTACFRAAVCSGWPLIVPLTAPLAMPAQDKF